MENIVGLKELREKMPVYEKKVAAGESFVVLKKSKPIFRISPINQDEESKWEEVVDFTKVKSCGVGISDLISRL